MQIHDITKRARRTDEGLLDGIKSAIGAAKTGYNTGGAAGVAKALTSPSQFAVAQNQTALNAADKIRQAINKKYGFTGDKEIKGTSRSASDLFAPLQAPKTQATVQQQVQVLVKTMEPEFNDLSAVLPDPGQVLVLKATKDGAKYYKTGDGQWFVQPAVGGQPLPLNPEQIKYAETQIEKDQYGQEPAPLNEAAGISRAAVNAARKTAEQKLKASVAKVVAPLAAKNKINAKSLLDGPGAAKAFQQINTISSAPASKIKTKKDKKQRIKKVFVQYATAALSGAQGEANDIAVGNNNQSAAPVTQLQKAQVAQTITRKTGQDGAKIVQGAEQDPEVKQALATITKESLQERLAKKLKLIHEAEDPDFSGLDDNSKDLVVSTAKGDYIKSGADSKWRDPKGTVIDPNKYADYVAKLEARAANQQSLPQDNTKNTQQQSGFVITDDGNMFEKKSDGTWTDIHGNKYTKKQDIDNLNSWDLLTRDEADVKIMTLSSKENMRDRYNDFAEHKTSILSLAKKIKSGEATPADIKKYTDSFDYWNPFSLTPDNPNKLNDTNVVSALSSDYKSFFDNSIKDLLSSKNLSDDEIEEKIKEFTGNWLYAIARTDSNLDQQKWQAEMNEIAKKVDQWVSGNPAAKAAWDATPKDDKTSVYQKFNQWNKETLINALLDTDDDETPEEEPYQYSQPQYSQPSRAQQERDEYQAWQTQQLMQQYGGQSSHNQQVQDTFNQLQNAKIYNTGQEGYLKDRLAALMAMKEHEVKIIEKKLLKELVSLAEDQVAITKDIVVRTASGNYVKSAKDQTWYDPNGVAIDPEKYADYVKKLDRTPQAQTQYQSDANKGMTSSFIGTDKGFQSKQAAKQAAANAPQPAAPVPQPAAPDPLQQIADQQKMAAILRNRDITGLNSMINDTFNQLQNAKIFNTGQEDYLKDRMAALMAMKA